MSTAATQTAREFRLAGTKPVARDVSTFSFVPLQGEMFGFAPGEYVTLYFTDGRFEWQGKSYSVSNQPGDGRVDITVKKVGAFSGAIHSLAPGDRVKLVGPTGEFRIAPGMRQIVFLAAGIGIVPFYSMINHLAAPPPVHAPPPTGSPPRGSPSVTLFYSNRTRADEAFGDELQALAAKLPGFTLVRALTRDRPAPPGVETARIDRAMLERHGALGPDRDYFMCGSISFVNDMWRMLQDAGIAEDRLFTEAYY